MKQKDKQNISQLEKKLKAEQEARSFVEKQLMEEKKRKKLEEATAARAVAFAAASRYVHVTVIFNQGWRFDAWVGQTIVCVDGLRCELFISLFQLHLGQFTLLSNLSFLSGEGLTLPHIPDKLPLVFCVVSKCSETHLQSVLYKYVSASNTDVGDF